MRFDSDSSCPPLEQAYTIVRSLGVGSRAEVFLAICDDDTSMRLDTPPNLVALKCMHERMHHDGGLVGRFYHEARFLGRLSTHPNLVDIQDVGCWNQRHTMVLEYVRGVTLRTYLDAYPASISPAIALEIIYQLAHVLYFLKPHGSPLGFVHGDLSPANVLLDLTGRIRLIDFDVAMEIQHDEQITAMGTLPYISPEQCEERPLDPRSDLFVLGTLLWEMLRGECPYPRFDRAHAMLMLTEAQIPSPIRPNARHPNIHHIWSRLHALRREARYTDMAELIRDIDALNIREDPGTRQLLAQQITALVRRL